MALHVIVGQEDVLAEVMGAARSGETVSWIISKAAAPAEIALLFFPHLDAFIGRGEVMSIPEGTMFGRRFCYKADVGNIVLFPKRVQLGVVADQFPDWEWPGYPRSFTSKLPEHLLAAVMKLAGKARRVGG